MDIEFERVKRSQVVATHPGLSGAVAGDRSRYRWLEDLVFPAQVLSVTGLGKCARYRWHLNRAVVSKSKPDANGQWMMLRGSLAHAGIEAYADHPGAEVHLWHRLNSRYVLAGTADFIEADTNGVRVADYKTSRSLPDMPKRAHVWQVRAYAFLLRANGCELPMTGEIVYLTDESACAYRFDLVPFTLAEIAGFVGAAERDEEPPAEPVEPWECSRCPVTSCPRHGRRPEPAPRQSAVEGMDFGLGNL